MIIRVLLYSLLVLPLLPPRLALTLLLPQLVLASKLLQQQQEPLKQPKAHLWHLSPDSTLRSAQEA